MNRVSTTSAAPTGTKGSYYDVYYSCSLLHKKLHYFTKVYCTLPQRYIAMLFLLAPKKPLSFGKARNTLFCLDYRLLNISPIMKNPEVGRLRAWKNTHWLSPHWGVGKWPENPQTSQTRIIQLLAWIDRRIKMKVFQNPSRSIITHKLTKSQSALRTAERIISVHLQKYDCWNTSCLCSTS